LGNEEVGGRRLGWWILLAGLLAGLALSGLQTIQGVVSFLNSPWLADPSLADFPPGDREWWLSTQIRPAIVRGLLAEWGTLLVLFAALVVVHRRAFPFRGGGSAVVRYVLPSVAVVAVTATPVFILVNATDGLSQQWLSFKLSRMTPAELSGQEVPSFYIDPKPQSLRHGRRGLYAALTGGGRADYSEAALLDALAASRDCPDLLKKSLGPEGEGEPARCVTAIEARLCCEARGMRLPTPDEWDAALAAASPTAEPDGGLSRGPFGEWTMRMVHSTATFRVRGRDRGNGVNKLDPDHYARDVGFRCVYRFEQPQ